MWALVSVLLYLCLPTHNVQGLKRRLPDRHPSNFVINLDAKPEQRWQEVAREFKPFAADMKKIASLFDEDATVRYIKPHLPKLLPQEMIAELKGIAEASDLSVPDLAIVNLFYDLTSYDMDAGPSKACTSIVSQDAAGHIYLGRNLDFRILKKSLLKDLTISVDFQRNGKTVYSGITFAFYVGLLTGQRNGAFAISLNQRITPPDLLPTDPKFVSMFQHPVAYVLRNTLEKQSEYGKAVSALESGSLLAPCYIIIAGTKPGEGTILTRSSQKTVDKYLLDPANNRWFIVQANDDRLGKQSDDRKQKAEEFLFKLGQINSSNTTAFFKDVLQKSPVYAGSFTVFSTILSPADPQLMKDTLLVRGAVVSEK